MLLTRHGVAIQVGSDGFLQLVVRGRLLEPQAQIELQVLVQPVTWKGQDQVNKGGIIRANGHNNTDIEALSGRKEANEQDILLFLTKRVLTV